MSSVRGIRFALLAVLIPALVLAGTPVYPAAASADEVSERIGKAIVLYVGSPLAFVNNARTQVDPEDRDVRPFVKNGRTLVPVRFVAEKMGGRVDWDGKTSTITITIGGKKVRLVLGSAIMTVNGKAVTIDVPAQAVNGRTLIPVRAVAEAFGKQVFYSFGLIIISNQKDIINPDTEEHLAHEITMLFNEGFDNSGSDGSDLDYNIVSDDPAVRVVVRHFDAINEKNMMKYRTTVSSRFTNMNPSWDDIFRVKLISVDESKATITKQDYMTRGYGQISKPYDVRIFSVRQEIHRIRETFGVGWYSEPVWNYVVVKETADGPWVIDDWSY